MSLRICVLGSGSSGNCTYVGTEAGGVLIDAGLSGVETARRLARAGLAPEHVRAVCVTHEHSDHISGLRVLHQRHGIPVYANAGTAQGYALQLPDAALPWNIFGNGSPFPCGGLEITPFSVPHDAADPVGFLIRHAGLEVGVVTDLGISTILVQERLRNCRALVLECNHDEQLLLASRRPWPLKQRIRGRQGHLSNAGAAELLLRLAGPHLCCVFLAHLSQECNREDLALETVRTRLSAAGHPHVHIFPTYPDRISEMWDLE